MRLRDLFESIISGVHPSSTYEEAVEQLVNLFSRADERILILSADLSTSVFKSETVLDALEQASRRGVAVKIVSSSPQLSKDARLSLIARYPRLGESFEVRYLISEESLNRAFTVVDGRHVRVERNPSRGNPGIIARMQFSTWFLGKQLDKDFELFYSQSV